MTQEPNPADRPEALPHTIAIKELAIALRDLHDFCGPPPAYADYQAYRSAMEQAIVTLIKYGY